MVLFTDDCCDCDCDCTCGCDFTCACGCGGVGSSVVAVVVVVVVVDRGGSSRNNLSDSFDDDSNVKEPEREDKRQGLG